MTKILTSYHSNLFNKYCFFPPQVIVAIRCLFHFFFFFRFAPRARAVSLVADPRGQEAVRQPRQQLQRARADPAGQARGRRAPARPRQYAT